MGVLKEQLSHLKEQYDRAMQLVDEESKIDPETEPYRSHYAAREIFLELANTLKEQLDQVPDSEPFHIVYRGLLGYIYRDLGRLHLFVEEKSTGKAYFENAAALLESSNGDAECIIPLIMVHNELGLYNADLDEKAVCIEHLEKAKLAYESFNRHDNRVPFIIADLFGYAKGEQDVDKSWRSFEKMHTLTLYYMAQVMEQSKAVLYLYGTLKRQLEHNDYESFDWALNAATFSQFFLSCDGVSTARHLMAAATLILSEYEKVMLTDDMTDEQRAAKVEKFNNTCADVDRCWATYCYHLLVASKERLLKDDEEADAAPNEPSMNVAGGKKLTPTELAALREKYGDLSFASLNTGEFEDQVTDQYALDMEDANKIWRFGADKLNHSKEYYTADTHASDYAKIVQNACSLLSELVFFEEDEARQCKMYKKCADDLEGLVQLLNPVYFKGICRELHFELGSIYTKMLNIKLDRAGGGQSADTHATNKINKLAAKAIINYTNFIESYHSIDSDPRDNIFAGLDDEEVTPLLFAYYNLGRLYYKIITRDKEQLLGNLTRSMKYYNFFVEGCKKKKQYEDGFKAGLSMSREMVTLLSKLIQRTICDVQRANVM